MNAYAATAIAVSITALVVGIANAALEFLDSIYTIIAFATGLAALLIAYTLVRTRHDTSLRSAIESDSGSTDDTQVPRSTLVRYAIEATFLLVVTFSTVIINMPTRQFIVVLVPAIFVVMILELAFGRRSQR